MKKGFTLIELIVAFAFVAMATVSVLQMVRSSLRQVLLSKNLSIASQAVLMSGLPEKERGAVVREVRSEEIEMGPVRIQSVLLEIVPQNDADTVRLRVYK